MINKTLCRILLLSLLASPLPVFAACIPLLGCSCSASATGVVFGIYNAASNRDVSGFVSVTCGGLVGIVNYSIALNRGIYSADFDPRQLGSGANRLNYNLYTSGTYATIWGDGSGTTGTITDSYLVAVGNTTRSYEVFGRIPAGQTTAVPGYYSDTITVTVTYN